jgi:membrane-associated phospholipid phosphatase
MHFLTDFADQAVLLPLSAVVTVTMFTCGWRRGTLAWVGAIVGVSATVLVLKLVFAGCPILWNGLLLQSPSGHTAAAAMVYGSLAALLLQRFGVGWVFSLLPAAFVVGVIGWTRLALGVHTAADVLTGAAIGLIGVVIFVAAARRPPAGPLVPAVLVAATTVIGITHGIRMDAETGIQAYGRTITHSSGICMTR